MTNDNSHTGFWKYTGYMLREAIEPIMLTLGLAALYNRLQSISEVSEIKDVTWLHALIKDSDANPYIYILLACIFVAWVTYKAWKLSSEKKREKELNRKFDEQSIQLLDIKKSQTEISNMILTLSKSTNNLVTRTNKEDDKE